MAIGNETCASVRDLDVVPDFEDPTRFAHITSAREAVHAMDAARAWLLHHNTSLTIGQMASIARSSTAITTVAGQVIAQTHLQWRRACRSPRCPRARPTSR
jgi:hypothetical protein